ncbi:MAG: pyruvate:ferredoxin (flavodoxin) oxidoreductase [Bacteroidetes Order II. Incertae sedis bacterium]|nr:pyruvate:ferredoxin (flavodoxin) oxidoreductase [Bacteroidetes Order II. bacterium]
MKGKLATMDGNQAAAHIAYRTNEVVAIYPITPASPMGEFSDLWSAQKAKNIWGTVPRVIEMQAEGGAAGTVHGALQSGSLTTTFTASQGLLLMIPNMYKIAGELTPTVFHIAARSLAAQGLSIFGDHSDVMAARATGWSMLFSNSVQEAMDLALISHAATLGSRIPFMHIFDGFRTSHELKKIELVDDATIREMIQIKWVMEHRARGLTPDNPFIRGTAQNPDVYFQARESSNSFYNETPGLVQDQMDKFGELTGRQYRLFDYVGHPEAESVVILMGSGAETVEETVNWMVARGEKIGAIKVRLFRPFSVDHLMSAVPTTVKAIGVLDRTKEPGSVGEPLYQDVVTGFAENALKRPMPKIIGGRYGLSSKEFTPPMVRAIFDELTAEESKNHFTIGINDDVTHSSLTYDPSFSTESDSVTRAVFWGLGSDGTVGANKNSIKIIGEGTDFYAQGYFVYDSKKAGARTISHLRFGTKPIHSTYLISRANFVAVHQFGFLERYDTLGLAEKGATFLLNSPYTAEEVWDHLPTSVQGTILEKELRFVVVDAYKVAKEVGLGVRINTIMQAAFFALSGILTPEDAVRRIKDYIQKTYGKRGEAVVRQNNAAVDAALHHMHDVNIPAEASSTIEVRLPVPVEAPDFVRSVTAEMIAGRGDDLPVSALPVDGTYPSATTQWEKRDIALEIPEWDPDLCIQCGKCVIVCPHSVIRSNVVGETELSGAPEDFLTAPASWKEFSEQIYTLQVSPEDCTGCKLCVEICPAKDKSRAGRKALNMVDKKDILERDRENWEFFTTLPAFRDGTIMEGDGASGNAPDVSFNKVKNVQLLKPLFEFSSACAGCGETPYLRLLTQLFGDRMMVANATGCSSIYGGNLPTTPWSKNAAGRGPSWSNSLFEDNAEFGLGMRVAVDKQREYARELVNQLRGSIGDELSTQLLEAEQETEEQINAQRDRVGYASDMLQSIDDPQARDLLSLINTLVRKSVWIIGGDGWAYDIGFGGLDHVLASGQNVNVLVLDTEVYSNTGGQASKATGLGAVAKFAAGGKATPKKDLGMVAMNYGYIYVAQVAMGANDNHVIKALREAEEYDGPSLVIAYSHCIAHGIDMSKGLDQQKLASSTGYWPLYRFDPRLKADGKNPFQLDSKKPSTRLRDYMYNENRYRILKKTHPEVAESFMKESEKLVLEKWNRYEAMARSPEPDSSDGPKRPASMKPPGSGKGPKSVGMNIARRRRPPGME